MPKPFFTPLSQLEVSHSLLFGTVELFASQRLLNLVIAFRVAKLGGNLSRMSTRVVAVRAKLCFTLRPALSTVTTEHVLVMLTEGVVVQGLRSILGAMNRHDDLARVGWSGTNRRREVDETRDWNQTTKKERVVKKNGKTRT